MTVSPGRRWRAVLRLFVASIGAVTLFGANTVIADNHQGTADQVQDGVQNGPPLRLTPRTSPEALPTLPVEAPNPGAAPAQEISATPQSTGEPVVTVDHLASPDPESVGTLDENSGGLSVDMWAGTPREFIERLLPRLPDRLASPTLRRLVRRLLLSTAIMPSHAADHRVDANRDLRPSLIATRVERLRTMGLVGAATALLDAAPTRDEDPLLLRLKVENLLIGDDLGGACAEALRQQGRVDDVFWQQAVIYCRILKGEVAEAALDASLLVESTGDTDPVFSAIVDKLSGTPSEPVDSMLAPTPLRLSMLRSANLPVPADALGTASSPLLRMIAVSPNAPLDIRLEAAERAARYGAITPERLAQIYAATEFTPTSLDNALSLAREDRTPRGRALLYQAGLANSVPAVRAEVLKLAFDLAREGGHYDLAVSLHEPILHTLSPTMPLPWFAASAARALYFIERPIPARSWLANLQTLALTDDTAKPAMDSLWALARLAGDMSLYEADAESRWRAALKIMDSEQAQRRINAAYILFAALGEPLSEAGWRAEIGDLQRRNAVLPDPMYRYALAEAAREHRVAETLLLTLVILGENGPADVDVFVMGDILSALRDVGFLEDARALAMEMAMSLGL
jgi:hypothetical protein